MIGPPAIARCVVDGGVHAVDDVRAGDQTERHPLDAEAIDPRLVVPVLRTERFDDDGTPIGAHRPFVDPCGRPHGDQLLDPVPLVEELAREIVEGFSHTRTLAFRAQKTQAIPKGESLIFGDSMGCADRSVAKQMFG